MIKIGVISDTHLTRPTGHLKSLLEGPFREAEMILHAGDITEIPILEIFAGKEVVAVCGNMDPPATRSRLPGQRVIEAGNCRIGLTHGWGAPQGIENRIAGGFNGVRVIVFGHTHLPAREERDGVLFFNPGSFGSGLGASPMSVGILSLGETVTGEIVYL